MSTELYAYRPRGGKQHNAMILCLNLVLKITVLSPSTFTFTQYIFLKKIYFLLKCYITAFLYKHIFVNSEIDLLASMSLKLLVNLVFII